MKHILIIGLFLIPALSFAQDKIAGVTNTETAIYKSPGAYHYNRQKADVAATIAEDTKIYCIGIIDTFINNGRSLYVVVPFADSVGYIPAEHVVVPGVRIVDLPKVDLTGIRLFYKGQKYKEFKELLKRDSIAQAADSLKYLKIAKTIINIGFGITAHYFPSDDYSVDFSVELVNYSRKTIKYVWLTLAFYNPVDDMIGTKTVKAVGPVDYGESASLNYENVLYTKVFEYGKITGVKIQYMDGTIRHLTTSQLRSVIL